jgi:hypothetical protein
MQGCALFAQVPLNLNKRAGPHRGLLALKVALDLVAELFRC